MPNAKLRRRRKKGQTHNWLAEWLNYREGDPTPHDVALDEVQAEAVEVSAADLDKVLKTKIEYDPGAPGPLFDEETALACRDELRRFADTWLDARYDLGKWQLRQELESALRERKPILAPGNPPFLYLEYPVPNKPKANGYGYAVWFFYTFITSPLFDRLARCKQCKRYYVARRRG